MVPRPLSLYLSLQATCILLPYLLTNLPIGRVELCLVSTRLCLVSIRLLAVAFRRRLIARATSCNGCAQHLTWQRLQQRTCAPNAPYGTERASPVHCQLSDKSEQLGWAVDARNTGNARELCATRHSMPRDRVCPRMGLAGRPAIEAISGHSQRHTGGRILECFCGERHDLLLTACRVLPRGVHLFPAVGSTPSSTPSRQLFPEKEARVESCSHSPRFGPHQPIA